MHSQTVTLTAAVIAAVVSVVTLLLNSKFTLSRERHLVLWREEVKRFIELEELAGELAELVGSYRPVDQDREKVATLMNELSSAAGRFARYPNLRQAIRDLHNVFARLWDSKETRGDDTAQLRTELETSHRAFLAEWNQLMGRLK